MMLKLKLQYFGHLMRRVDSLEKTLMLGGIVGRRRRGRQRMRGWMASLTWWTWVWVNSGSWWWTGRPGVLWFMGSQRFGHDWETELNWKYSVSLATSLYFTILFFKMQDFPCRICYVLINIVCAQSFSCVQLFGTPLTEAHQTLQSLGFSRQEYWNGLLNMKFQEIFLIQGLHCHLLCLLPWQANSLPLCYLGSPNEYQLVEWTAANLLLPHLMSNIFRNLRRILWSYFQIHLVHWLGSSMQTLETL